MEFLICASGFNGHDIGDIIDIRASGFNWGDEEKNGSIFKVIRIPNIEMSGVSLSHCLSDPVYYCDSCSGYIANSGVISHAMVSHSGIAYDANGNLKPLNQIGISVPKVKAWKIDINNDLLIEKIPGSGNNLIDRNKKTGLTIDIVYG
jgi:hypothetical protein